MTWLYHIQDQFQHLTDVEDMVQEFKYSDTVATRKIGMFIKRSSTSAQNHSCPCACYDGIWGSGDIAPLIPYLSSSWV